MPEPRPPEDAAAGSAMQQAVAAEQAARRAIADAEAAAVAAVEKARAQARAILNAVPGRVARLRERGERSVQRALVTVAAREAALTAKLHETAYTPKRLERALRELAQRLTGGGA